MTLIHDPRFRQLVLPNAPLVKLRESRFPGCRTSAFGRQVFHTISPVYAEGFGCNGLPDLEQHRRWRALYRAEWLLGIIRFPSTVSNSKFDGRNLSRLFLCASH
jgi:hypothetical protein